MSAKHKNIKQNDKLLDMKQAIKLLKTTRPTFYRWLRSGKIKAMKDTQKDDDFVVHSRFWEWMEKNRQDVAHDVQLAFTERLIEAA